MKIQISDNLIVTIGAMAASVGAHFKVIADNNPFLQERKKKEIKEHADLHKVSIEEATKQLSSKAPTDFKLLSIIKNRTLKLGTLTKTNSGVEFDINDDFLIEGVEIYTRHMMKLATPILKMYEYMYEYGEEQKTFHDKWLAEEKTADPEEVVVVKSRESKYGWTPDLSRSYSTDVFFVDNEKEEYFNIHGYTWVNQKGNTIDTYAIHVRDILESTKPVQELAEQYKMPCSLINEIRNYYGYEPLPYKEEVQV